MNLFVLEMSRKANAKVSIRNWYKPTIADWKLAKCGITFGRLYYGHMED